MTDAILRIDSLAFGGAGFGRLDGKACFVPFTAPGDLVRIRPAVSKSSYLEGELLEIVEPSPFRAEPPCPVFGVCGGCSWQHIDYAAQCEAKRQIFADTLWRFGRIEPDRVGAVTAAPEPYGYRSRVQFKVRWSGGKIHVGFYRRGSHFVIDIPERCAICHPSINRALAEIRQLLPRFAEPDRVPQVDVAAGDDGTVLAIIHYIGDRRASARDFFTSCRDALPSVAGIHLQHGRKDTIERIWGIDALTYTVPEGLVPGLPETRLTFSRGGFSQINYRQNLELIRGALRFCALRGDERVLDLFCGNGNFTLPLARLAAQVVGVEEYGPSLDDARHNASVNGIATVDYVQADTAGGLRALRERGERFPVVVLDPPRTGAKEAIAGIAALEPDCIVSVSCDPSTLARDLGLLRKQGYLVVESYPVDMFPQTYHIESLTLLRRAG